MTGSATGSALFNTFARAPLAFERGEGTWLITVDGERYLDFAGGIAVNSLGHSHPHLVQALTDQAGKLWHTSNLYEVPQQEKLAERLAAATFADRVFFTNSGAEALECAIKTARRYHYAKGNGDKFRILTFEGAFHGRTLATIAAGGQAKYIEGFGPKVDGFDQVPFNDIAAVKAAITPETAAILIEPLQGEGGIRLAPTAFLTDLRAICDEQDLLLIFDEVQTGIGRTGKLFAYERTGVTPDIMAIAKGIGGGFPVGACLASEDAAAGMVPGVHGTTFGGNQLAMAVGNAVLDVVLEEGFLEDIVRKANVMKQGLAEIADTYPDVVEDIRGEGLMLGLKCKMPNTMVNAKLRDEHLLAVPAGDNVVRLLPPLTLTDEEIRDGVERIRKAAQGLSQANGSAA
ncbi:aspartate aminotransferase family protein [Tianweitania sp. BSSL-BM11]|uniref:Acetylornithine aminotransferase n=1 Tax=Tianweitania aestuarii TaxID=2814886 RepID=A0ABS5RSR2_9HYPH|nr:aspartate aminotransferase family protein [Tianweitania aestuarii]MBS9719264.1 aspartate aminotransferase family protein [Tianweitania aestuarii]